MCELFGVNASEKIKLNELLMEFFSHGVDHPHGWGMAFFHDNGVSIEKQPDAAHKSMYLRQRLRAKIKEHTMIAHIRLATRGSLEYENCHPFAMRDNSGRTWTLAHNGTIFDCDTLNPFVQMQEGQTDSERILCYIISRMDAAQNQKGNPLSRKERFRILDEVMGVISPENKVNLLIYDGEVLYVHTNYKNSLYCSYKEEGVIFSTKPLNLGLWENVPMNTLLAYQDGKCIDIGTNHGQEFLDSEEKMRLLFLDFAGL
jgi:glutamine amidotransferase